MIKQKILLVDDESDILEFLEYNLNKEGFEVYTALNGLDALLVAKQVKPALIILDVMMPEMDGIETCEEIRKVPELSGSVIAFLTARNEDYSQIAGFEAGADDYINKPIKPKVFISRVKALLKRYARGGELMQENEHIISFENLIINTENHQVELNGISIELPRKEFKLIALLASKPDKVFTREEIYEKVWGNDVVVGDRTIDVHIRKLREKIGNEFIKTIKGVGYKFVISNT